MYVNATQIPNIRFINVFIQVINQAIEQGDHRQKSVRTLMALKIDADFLKTANTYFGGYMKLKCPFTIKLFTNE